MEAMFIPTVLLAAACHINPDDPLVLKIARRSIQSVAIDGQMSKEEWDGASEFSIAPGVTLLGFQTKADVLLAVRLKTGSPSYVDLFLLLEDGKRINLHASMQVGERELPATEWTDLAPRTHWGKQDRWQANFAREVAGADSSAPLPETIIPYDVCRFRFMLSPPAPGHGDSHHAWISFRVAGHWYPSSSCRPCGYAAFAEVTHVSGHWRLPGWRWRGHLSRIHRSCG